MWFCWGLEATHFIGEILGGNIYIYIFIYLLRIYIQTYHITYHMSHIILQINVYKSNAVPWVMYPIPLWIPFSHRKTKQCYISHWCSNQAPSHIATHVVHGPICMLRVPGTHMTEAACSICILGPMHVVSSRLGCHHHSNDPYSSGSPVELEGFHCQTCQGFCEVQFSNFLMMSTGTHQHALAATWQHHWAAPKQKQLKMNHVALQARLSGIGFWSPALRKGGPTAQCSTNNLQSQKGSAFWLGTAGEEGIPIQALGTGCCHPWCSHSCGACGLPPGPFWTWKHLPSMNRKPWQSPANEHLWQSLLKCQGGGICQTNCQEKTTACWEIHGQCWQCHLWATQSWANAQRELCGQIAPHSSGCHLWLDQLCACMTQWSAVHSSSLRRPEIVSKQWLLHQAEQITSRLCHPPRPPTKCDQLHVAGKKNSHIYPTLWDMKQASATGETCTSSGGALVCWFRSVQSSPLKMPALGAQEGLTLQFWQVVFELGRLWMQPSLLLFVSVFPKFSSILWLPNWTLAPTRILIPTKHTNRSKPWSAEAQWPLWQVESGIGSDLLFVFVGLGLILVIFKS